MRIGMMNSLSPCVTFGLLTFSPYITSHPLSPFKPFQYVQRLDQVSAH